MNKNYIVECLNDKETNEVMQFFPQHIDKSWAEDSIHLIFKQ